MRKKSKFVSLLLIALVSVLSVSSCGSKSVEGNEDPPPVDFDLNVSGGLEIDVEENYDNFSISMEKKVYASKDECLKCYLTNNNPGKGFYFYNVPLVEKKIDGEWVRLFYGYEEDRGYEGQYAFCGNENEPDRQFTAVLKVYPELVSPKMNKGEYRLVVFTGKNQQYVEFQIE